MSRLDDLTGKQFGRLTVLGRAENGNGRSAVWNCACECGGTHTVRADALKSGVTRSCRCLNRERVIETNTTHGMRGSSEYATWDQAKGRCHNSNHPQYAGYGGRGITICDRWVNSFENFFTDMGTRPSENHSIDRIDNDAGYSPENCRWATRTQQQRNTRTNRMLTHDGLTLCIAEWAERTGKKGSTLRSRLYLGWSVEQTLTVPVWGRRCLK